MSVYAAMYYRRTGFLPGQGPGTSDPTSIEAQTKAAFSMHHDDNFDDDGTRTEREGDQEEDEYQLLHAQEADETRHPGQPVNWGKSAHSRNESYDASYHGAYNEHNDSVDHGGI